MNKKTWAEIIDLLVLGRSAVTVSLGAQLAHIEGIGPKGNYIEQHEE